MASRIEVWYDETSDTAKPKWCVSLCAEDGDEIQCLSTHKSEGAAIKAGKAAAATRNITAVSRGRHGQTSGL